MRSGEGGGSKQFLAVAIAGRVSSRDSRFKRFKAAKSSCCPFLRVIDL